MTFTIHDETTAPEGSKELLEKAKSQVGFIPNLHAIMAEAPSMLQGYRAINELFLKSSLSKEEKTVVWQAVNVEHDLSEALRNEAPLGDPKLEALRTFTLAMVRNRGDVDEAGVKTFLDAGFTKRHILEVILGIAQKTMSNYTNHLADTPLDAAFAPLAWEKAS